MSELWGINIAGPDDIIAVSCRSEAVEMAHKMNAFFLDRFEKEAHEFDPLMWAIPKAWPHSAQSHSENLGDYGEYAWVKSYEATP